MAKATPRVLVGVRLPVVLARRLKVEAVHRGVTMQTLIEAAVTAFLSPKEKRH